MNNGNLQIREKEWVHLKATFSGLDKYHKGILVGPNNSQERMTYRTYPVKTENGDIFLESIFETHFRDTPFDEIRGVLEPLPLKGKRFTDIGMGAGAVCAVAHLLGADVMGVDCDGVMCKVARKAWDDFEGGIERKTAYDPIHEGNGLKFPIRGADFVWSYLMAEKQEDLLKRFGAEAKGDAQIILRYPTPNCVGFAKNLGFEKMDYPESERYIRLRKK